MIDLFIETANRRAIVSPSDRNPLLIPDISPPGTYDFNLFYLDYVGGGAPDTYRRYPGSYHTLRLRQHGPPTIGTVKFAFLGYTTEPIPLNGELKDVLSALEALRSIGMGNIDVSGGLYEGWTFEFIGDRAGNDQSLLQVDCTGCEPAASAVIRKIQTGGGSTERNCIQRVRLEQSPVASVSTLFEIAPAGNYGWTGTLDTTNVSPSFFDDPEFDIVLELSASLDGARSGADGVTTTDGRSRSGADGATFNDGRGRSGTDGVINLSAGRTISFFLKGGYEEIYNDSPNYFTQDDVGRELIAGTGTDCFTEGTVITAVGSKQLSSADFPGHGGLRSYALISLPSKGTGIKENQSSTTDAAFTAELNSATANFQQADLGHVVTGTHIRANTTITSILSATKAKLSQRPTGYGSSLPWSIVAQPTNKYQAAGGAFAAGDVGLAITGTNIPSGTTIVSILDAQNVTLSQKPTAVGSALAWTITGSFSTTYTAASAAFTGGDFGRGFTGANVPSNTTIVQVLSGTQVKLSKRPTAAGSSLAWSVVGAATDSPRVTSLQAGTTTQPSKQRIVFTGAPDYGAIVLSLDGIATTATIDAPLDPFVLGQALTIAFPDKGPFECELVAETIIDITFGINGAQSLFAVNDSALSYDNTFLQIVVVYGRASAEAGSSFDTFPSRLGKSRTLALVPSAASAAVPLLYYDGDFTVAKPAGELRIENLADGTGGFVVRQRFVQLRSDFVPQALNTPGRLGCYLVAENNMEDLGGGLVAWDRVWASLPKMRTEIHQQMRPCIGTVKTTLSGVLVDQQLFSVSISTWIEVTFSYHLGIPKGAGAEDGPAGTLLHFPLLNGATASYILAFNGFDRTNGTFGKMFAQSWSRRRWMGDIWETAVYRN